MTEQNIGLSELIEKVKADLLTSSGDKTAPFLFVESVELELQIVVKKDASTGLEIGVIGIVGGKIGGDLGQENVQTVKVTLSSLYSKEELKKYFADLYPKKVPSSIHKAQKAILKGEEDTDDTII